MRMSVDQFNSLQTKLKQTAQRPVGQPRESRPKRKFYNNPTDLDGMRFDSKAEAQRWLHLRMLEKAGEITDLRTQVRFNLLPAQEVGGHKEKPVDYICDFVYVRAGMTIHEDVKSGPTKTKEFILKRKMMLFFHGIKVIEVMAG